MHPISSKLGLHFNYLEYFDPYKSDTSAKLLREFLELPTNKQKQINKTNCGAHYKHYIWSSFFSFWNILIHTSQTLLLCYLESFLNPLHFFQKLYGCFKKTKLHPIGSELGLHFNYLEYFDPYKSDTSAKLVRGFLEQTNKQTKQIVVHPVSTTIGLHFFHYGIFWPVQARHCCYVT